MKRKKPFTTILLLLVVVFAGIQFIRPEVPHPPVTQDLDAPPEVKAILTRACYDCHSNQTNLRWYDQIAPVYWRVANHVKEGREGLNFSEWDKLDAGQRKGKLWESVNQVLAGAMPLKDYATVHSDAKISARDITVLKNYVSSLATSPMADTVAASKKPLAESSNLKTLPTAPNGIAYIPDYKNWQPISTTDRIDNNTMRVIFGNNVAVKAIHENKVNPWPDGSILAKVAWDMLEDKQGNIRTGSFKQVEYMIKDSKKYASTEGWGFARFKTPKMVPYGKTVMFTQECINCHRPVADQDFVFTSPLKN